jgi:hypothetical protein
MDKKACGKYYYQAIPQVNVMRKITTIEELREAIQLLEIQQKKEAVDLKEELNAAYERIHPINLINSTLKDAFGSVELKENLINASTIFASGLLSNVLLRGIKNNSVKKILSTGLMLVVTNFLSKHPDTIKNLANRLFSSVTDLTKSDQSYKHNGSQESVAQTDSAID